MGLSRTRTWHFGSWDHERVCDASLAFLSRGTGISQHIARSNTTRTPTHDSIHERYQVPGTQQAGYPLVDLGRIRTWHTGSWDHEYAL